MQTCLPSDVTVWPPFRWAAPLSTLLMVHASYPRVGEQAALAMGGSPAATLRLAAAVGVLGRPWCVFFLHSGCHKKLHQGITRDFQA